MIISAKGQLKIVWRWLLFIFIVALVYRALYFYAIWEHPLFGNPVIDAQQHHAWAQRISSGSVLGQGPDDVFKPYLYPLLLGGIYYLTGPSPVIVQWMQFLIGSISAALTGWLGYILFRRKIGLAAGFIFALYAPFVFFEGQLLSPAISIFLNLIVTLLLISPVPSWGKAGAVGGIAAGFRPDVSLD